MIVVDTSVAVAAALPWHEAHAAALSAAGYDHLLELAAAERITGGAVYDALVAATAREVGTTLISLDERAVATYRRMSADYRIVRP